MKNVFCLFAGAILFLTGCSSVENDYSYISTLAREDWAAWHGKAVAKKTPKNDDSAKNIAAFIRGLETFAPYMLEEFAVIDREMNWKPGTAQQKSIFGMDMKSTPAPHECTSWIIMPELIGGKELILHKNRDSKSRYITAFQMAVPGKYSWIGNGNFGGTGTTSGINEKALVIAMNSGAKTTEPGLYGLGTTLIARILLENCATVDEAIDLLGRIIDAKVYNHGKNTGSTWFFADRNGACIIEQSASHMAVQKMTTGIVIRGNHWILPEMLPYSRMVPAETLDNVIREFHVHNALINGALHKNKIITMPDIARAARINSFPENEKWYKLCDKYTNVSSTFVIDLEYPEELSFFSSTFGPPRHGIFIPVPLTLDKLPLEMRNGAWSEEIFDRKEAGKEPDLKAIETIEAKLLARHKKAVESARKLLQNGGSKADAAALLKTAFLENLQEAKEFQFTFPETAAAEKTK